MAIKGSRGRRDENLSIAELESELRTLEDTYAREHSALVQLEERYRRTYAELIEAKVARGKQMNRLRACKENPHD